MTEPQRGLRRGLTQYGDPEFALFLRRSFIRSMGFSEAVLERPIVGIVTSPSELNTCHRTMGELVEAVRRGALAAGALPLAFPTISLGEPYLFPTSLFLRNLMAIDVEEMIRAQPLDAVVLVGGCDKTVPAQLMGAASAEVPAVVLVVGPMLTGRYRGERLSACTDCRRFWARYRAGELDAEEIRTIEGRLAVTAGTCGVMGTASTMACLAEAMGLALPGSAAVPAVHADRLRIAEATGALAAALPGSGRTIRAIVTEKNLENAMRVLLALSGSTNAVIHLAAIAGRLGLPFSLRRLDALSEETPVLVDLKPTGRGYMEDFHAAGGMPALLRELAPLLHLDAPTIDGRTLGAVLAEPAREPVDREIIRPLSDPIAPRGGLVALFGTLAPEGAVLKRAAASPELFEHEGRAVVFESLEDLARRIDDPELDVAPSDVLVLKNAGPASPARMPEAGYLPIPKKLARAGVKDMVRISDARMSGTAFGTVILHVAPDAASGGPLALARTGDRIRLSVRERRLDLLVEAEELARRREAWRPPPPPERGWARLWHEEILQAPQGCDFRVLRANGREA
ncbi:MAG: dihydroxy-acid dehydratase [Geminicoccaceae bacterium]|nr:dihydroxy-acid dehydratase [Geminicoccaceae bacterium]MCS7268381.1 dihydroxy-acid dehydratase [Geminicoccaceae bacterium]MCX7629443.1 dihydroxy-acid dehydratase [Geminicoccaceae bacterium]MDW8124274.1 dihydroxy-acid dehydratase [Geminicoccaceae bacterium]MDW8341117.1 dihydroxy-acid dehydratase [Geminicoccaceae bacterium]